MHPTLPPPKGYFWASHWLVNGTKLLTTIPSRSSRALENSFGSAVLARQLGQEKPGFHNRQSPQNSDLAQISTLAEGNHRGKWASQSSQVTAMKPDCYSTDISQINWVRNCITSLFKGRFRYIV